MKKKYYIKDFDYEGGCIEVYNDKAFISLNLCYYAEADALSRMLVKLTKIGFTNIETSHDLGYYDEVENICLELSGSVNEIDFSQLGEIIPEQSKIKTKLDQVKNWYDKNYENFKGL